MDTERLRQARVLPVITPSGVDPTLQLVGALVKGGILAVEITLRGQGALDSLLAVRENFPSLLLAAGTVKNASDLQAVKSTGADLALSPGATPELLSAAAELELPFIPGIATASELMQGLAAGFTTFKLFPAVPLGGIDMLKSLAGPFPDVLFCPTGGLHAGNFRAYLALENVLCCGGSWMVTEDLVAAGNWAEIERLACEAMSA